MRLFTDVLRDWRNGRLVDRLTDEMAKLTAAVDETGKEGSLTLSIKLKPKTDNRGVIDIVELHADVTTKIPRHDLPAQVFFLTTDGDLVKDDPTQREMFVAADVGDASDRPARRRRAD